MSSHGTGIAFHRSSPEVAVLTQTVLDAVYEYQKLLHLKKTMEIAPSSGDIARTAALRRLLTGQVEGRSSRSLGTRLAQPLPVHLTVPGGFRSGELRSVSAGGLAVVVRGVPRGVRRTVVQVTDAKKQVEYVFPGRVVWGNGVVVGIAFDGLPSCSPLTGLESWSAGRWASPLGGGFSVRIERRRPSSPRVA